MTWVTVTPQVTQADTARGAALSETPVQVGVPAGPVHIQDGVDFLMCQTLSGGDIEIKGGIVNRTSTPETAVYLSLFGGADYWANLDETDPDYMYMSKTGAALDNLTPTSDNIKKLEDAIRADLAWLGADIVVVVTVPAIGRVSIYIELAPGESVEFEENWSAIK